MDSIDTIDDEKQRIIDEFSLLTDWTDRYEYIIELGRKLDGLPDALKTDASKVPGCQSQVWFHAWRENGRLYMAADSDALIVRGLIALLLRVYSGRTPDEILRTPADFFEAIELGSHLTGSRANGLHAMIGRIHAFAEGFASLDHSPEAGIAPAGR